MVDDGFTVLDMGKAMGQHKRSANAAVEVMQVPLAQVYPNPYQPRKQFEEEPLAELAASIKQYGILQPLLVTRGEDGRFMLIAGERRLRAATMAKLTNIPVIISDYTNQQIAEIAMIENLQREDLHYLEEAEGYEKLLNQFKLTQEAMAYRVGKKQSTIANKLRLLKLPQEVRAKLRENDLTERHARVLLKLSSPEAQLQVLDQAIKQGLNVRQTEALVEKLLNGAAEDKPKRKLLIVNDVRIYLNSVKQIVSAINTSGIPAAMEQEVEGDEVVVTLRIKNTKATDKKAAPKLF